MNGVQTSEQGRGVQLMAVNAIALGRNVRVVDLTTSKGKAFVESIKEHGILQPLLVRPVGEDGPDNGGRKVELVAGYRRWYAAADLKLEQVPVLVREMTAEQVLKYQLVENLQREEMTALDEAEALCRLHNELGLSVDQIQAEIYGQTGKKVSRSGVYDTMNLAKLTDKAKAALREGKIDRSTAIKLLTFKTAVQDTALEVALGFQGSFKELSAELDWRLKSRAEKEEKWRRLVEEAELKGQTVLTAASSPKVAKSFSLCGDRETYYVPYDAPLVKANEECHEIPRNKDWTYPKWGELLKKSTVPLYLVQAPDGQAHELYDRAAATKWLRDAGIIKKAQEVAERGNSPTDDATRQWKEALAKVQHDRKDAFRDQFLGAVVANIELSGRPLDALRLLVQLDGYGLEEVSYRRNVDENELAKEVESMSLEQVVALLVEMKLEATSYGWKFSEESPELLVAKLCNLDLALIRKAVEEKHPLPEKPAKPEPKVAEKAKGKGKKKAAAAAAVEAPKEEKKAAKVKAAKKGGK